MNRKQSACIPHRNTFRHLDYIQTSRNVDRTDKVRSTRPFKHVYTSESLTRGRQCVQVCICTWPSSSSTLQGDDSAKPWSLLDSTPGAALVNQTPRGLVSGSCRAVISMEIKTEHCLNRMPMLAVLFPVPGTFTWTLKSTSHLSENTFIARSSDRDPKPCCLED